MLTRLLLLSAAGTALHAGATFTSTASGNFNGGPYQQVQTITAGAPANITLNSGTSVAAALTDWGLVRVSESSTSLTSNATAFAQFNLDFTLSGGTPGAFVPLSVYYSYDFVESGGAFGSGYFASFTYGIYGNGASQGNPYEVLQIKAVSSSDGSLEYCPTRFATPGPQACLGAYSGSGVVNKANDWIVGNNHLGMEANATGDLDSINAYNTGRITMVVVPDGINWDYGTGVAGNPLNFVHQSAVNTPEPATWALLAFALTAGCLRRRSL